jgi:membrane-bound ClpP family serine protease
MLGRIGVVCDDLDPDGFVQLGSERWRAVNVVTGSTVPAGTAVRVCEVRRLTLVVEATNEPVSGLQDG